MSKTLIKKQMMELFSFFWQDRKKNKNRTGGKLVLWILLYLALFGVIAVMFFVMADMLCEPLIMADMGWFYFALTGLVGIVMGVFGSVFNTYASLYSAKDNALLLSMPIPTSRILAVRLTGVYAMGLMYELLVMIPVLIKYFIAARPGILTVVCAVLVTVIISVFILILSAVLGWGVAQISAKTKHKSIITVVLSLVFIAAYYYVYGMAMGFLQDIVANPQIAGKAVKGHAFWLYMMGKAAEGDIKSLLIFAAVVLVLFAAMCFILAKSYTKLVTTNKGEAKVKYKEKRATVHSTERALLGKEMKRFLGSPNYMLNCGLGIVLMIIAAIVLLVKADTVTNIILMVFQGEKDFVSMIAAAAICIIAGMNDITAPSVSLEGKNLWLVQVFPVSARQVLMAKIKLHLLLTLVPTAILTASVELVLKPELAFAVLIPAAAFGFVLFMASLGIALNLKLPNLTWTSEIVPIKQSMGVMIALFGGWVLIMGFAGLYYLLRNILSPVAYLICTVLLILGASAVLLGWIRNKGAHIFETL